MSSRLGSWLLRLGGTPYCQARAFASADASAVMPFDFLRLPLGALFGYLLFAEIIDTWTWVGAVVIFFSGYYIVKREFFEPGKVALAQKSTKSYVVLLDVHGHILKQGA